MKIYINKPQGTQQLINLKEIKLNSSKRIVWEEGNLYIHSESKMR